jgi:YVTN family beta-propeller protein
MKRPYGKQAGVLCLAAVLATGVEPVALGQVAYVNFEGKQANPVRLSPDGTRLFAVNTPDARLSVFDVSSPANPILVAEIPVGVEPVSVNPRSNDEAWVVNEVSDSVSIVSISRGIVTATLPAKDEPSDVVFAAGRAFVSCSRNNQIRVFDTVTHAETASIPLAGVNPRALAVSPDGKSVYAAFALSGNRTTIIPPALAPPQPPPVNITNAPPQVGLIVDAADPSWAPAMPFAMPDNDVVEIDATAMTATRYFSRIGTVNLGLAVHPITGDLFVANTDARNLVHFEPNLRGHVVDNRISRITLADESVSAFDLNPGVDYSTLPNPAALATALAQPTAMVFDRPGRSLYVAAFGTDRIARIDTNGTVLSRIEIGPATGDVSQPRTKRGPRGLALSPDGAYLYVLNRIANSLSVIATATETVLRELAVGSYDPTTPVIRQGRGFLYDAKLSGAGTMSCASCHVDAEMDMLAWDLGDPYGKMEVASVVESGGAVDTEPRHPMKGPMTTQTLRGLSGQNPLHWRGDRATFLNFNPAFGSLLGGTVLSNVDMAAYRDFINTIVFEPNPNQTLDRKLPATLDGANPTAGRKFFSSTPVMVGGESCIICHADPTGSNLRIASGPSLLLSQAFKAPHLRNVYQKLLFTGSTASESLSGFGLTHDGHDAGLLIHFASRRFLPILTNHPQTKLDLTAYIMCYDTGTAPAVGYSRTLTAGNVKDPAITNDWFVLENQPLANIGLIVKGTIGGVRHGLLYDRTIGMYQTDQTGWGPLSHNQLLAGILAGDTVTIMGVPPASRLRMGIDRNGDGVLDGDEVPPVLSATLTSDGLVISWPTNSVGTVLEFSDDLAGSVWRTDTSVQTAVADQVAVTVPVSPQPRFFRLRQL